MTDDATTGRAIPERPTRHVRRIFGAMLALGGVTLVVKGATVVKELLVASRFGVNDALDAFLMAYMLPAFAVAVLGSAFQASLIPAWVRAREVHGVEAANRLVSNTTTVAISMLLGCTVVLGLAFPFVAPIVASGFRTATLDLTQRLFYVLLPLVLVGGVAGVWTSALNAGERFVFAGLVPLMTPATIAGLLILLPADNPWLLALGTLAGSAAELGLLGIALRHHGIPVRPRWYGMDPLTRQVLRQYAPMVVGALLMSSTVVVDQSMAGMLGPGAVSALSYGNKLVGFCVGVAAMAVGTAVLPAFSIMVARNDWDALGRTVRFYSMLIGAAALPVTLLIAWFSTPIVHLLFERGAFTAADTQLVGAVQRAFVWQVPFYLLATIGVRLLSSLERNLVLTWIAALNVVLNVLLNIVLSRAFGVAGIALSTSIVYVSSCALVFASLTKELRARRARG